MALMTLPARLVITDSLKSLGKGGWELCTVPFIQSWIEKLR